MKRLPLAVGAMLALAGICAPAGQASCVSAVVADGSVLIGLDASGWTLPRAAGTVRAVVPACNDAGQSAPDRSTTMLRLAGVPATIAVRSVDGDELYMAAGSLTALASHPLHPPARRLPRRACTRRSTVEGVAGTAGFDALELIAGGRSRFYRVDAGTTLVNRPAYQPVRRGQRLSVEATRCGRRLIADRIAFTGPTIVPERYARERDPGPAAGLPLAVVLVLGALGLALIVGLIERVTRP